MIVDECKLVFSSHTKQFCYFYKPNAYVFRIAGTPPTFTLELAIIPSLLLFP